jgi:hypothetical protein
MWVLDKKTGKHSVIFDVGAIQWLTEEKVEVEGGYLCGSLCMAEGTYHVIREGTYWVVTGFSIRVIS